MMNYLAGLLGIALMGAVTTAAIYRGDSLSWQNKYNQRVAQEQTAAQQAKDDAAKQEAKDTAALNAQSSKAIQQATSARNQAQLTAATYQQKLAQLAGKQLDIGHQCALTPVPSDLLP